MRDEEMREPDSQMGESFLLAGPGKKLGVGEGFAGRKTSGVTSWGGKFSKAMDRMTTTKGCVFLVDTSFLARFIWN